MIGRSGGRGLGIAGAAAACLAVACSGGSGTSPGDAAPWTYDAGPDARAIAAVPPEIDGQITINELMASNALTAVDDAGVASDWVELYNPTDVDVPIDGYTLTDDLDQPRRGVIGAGVVLPAHGRVVVWFADGPGAPTRLPFGLAEEGGVLAFARPDGSFIDRVSYGSQETDLSAARQPDGSDRWQVAWIVTPGQPNAAGEGAPVALEDPSTPPEEIPAAGDVSERVLGYDVLATIELTISPDGMAALEARPREYVQASITFEGRTYGPVGVRLKGQNSFQPIGAKPSLRINVDEYAPAAKFFGLKDLTLNNMDDDYSMMHERLSYYVARQAGLPASRSNHALLTLNGAFYGLYANVETVKRPMIRRWFVDDAGPLFEATDVDFATAYVAGYALKTGPDDRSLIEGLSNALAMASADDAIAAAAAYADVDQFIRFWAMCALVAQFDSFPYSNPGDDYLLYADPLSGRLHILPWGMDETFYSAEYGILQVNSRFATRCLESTACRQTYVDAVWDALTEFEALDLETERLRVIAEIAPYVSADTRKPYTDAVVADFQQQMHWFFKERRMRIGQMLPPPSP